MNYDPTKYFQIIDNSKLKTSDLLNQCRKKFEVYSYYDDKELDKQFPPPKKATTRYFKRNVEADEEYANKSADDLEKMGVKVITLRERILAELQYFEETGDHLDIENITLCSGSRFADGYVPHVDWRGEFFIGGGYYPDDAHPLLRTRVAVSLEPSSFNTSTTLGHFVACPSCGAKLELRK